jgi:Flp pilus assembly protein TadD
VLQLWAVFNFGEKNYAEAERQLKKAVALDSTNAMFWNNLGYMYNLIGRYAEAEPVLKKAVALDSTNIYAWSNFGGLYTNTRRYAEAEQSFNKAIALDSAFVHPWNGLGLLYINTRRYAEAEQVLKKTITLDSSYASAWNNLGFLYNSTRRYAEVEPVCKKAIALDSTNIYTWNNLGYSYCETNRFDESEKMYRKAFAMDADFKPTYRNYCTLKIKMGDLQAAFSYLEQAIQKGYNDYQGMQTGAGLAPLREQKEQWEALMKKHFANLMYYNLACEQSLKGELDKAFESLELSLTNGWKDYDWMKQDTDLAPLREQKERWGALMKKYFSDK